MHLPASRCYWGLQASVKSLECTSFQLPSKIYRNLIAPAMHQLMLCRVEWESVMGRLTSCFTSNWMFGTAKGFLSIFFLAVAPWEGAEHSVLHGSTTQPVSCPSPLLLGPFWRVKATWRCLLHVALAPQNGPESKRSGTLHSVLQSCGKPNPLPPPSWMPTNI